MKLHKANKKVKEMQESIDKIPYEVWTCFWDTHTMADLCGDNICFGNADYKTLDEMRHGVEWLVDQFGGEVKWKD